MLCLCDGKMSVTIHLAISKEHRRVTDGQTSFDSIVCANV